MSNEDKIPKVFISYSHDTPEHKKWVGDFASRLVSNGVEVIFDQWDLSLGDDLIKFMERSLTNADRVLMICTEPYVRKADDGKGGVGYEAMIVTGELVRNLGTSKFIPIIRQGGNEVTLPKSLSTRFYVNLKDGATFNEEFDKLLRELHKAPALSKPQLGKNPYTNISNASEDIESSIVKAPFAIQPSGIEIPVEETFVEAIPDISKINDNVEAIYETALNIARRGDIVAWRKIIRQAKQFVPEKLNAWRGIQDHNPPKTKEEQANVAIGGVTPYAPLFAIALAGVESGREKFNNQISVLDEALNPPNWNKAGYVIIADFPETSAYVYHLLHGAVCLLTDQMDIAVSFARSKIRERRIENSIPVLYNHTLTGWPVGLGSDCKIAWGFIKVLPEKWKWLYKIFGDLQDYQSSLCAYYLVLNILEFIGIIASGHEQTLLEDKNITLHVPLTFLQESDEILRRGYQLLLNDPVKLRNIWKESNLDEKKLSELWPRWLYHMEKWLDSIYFFGPGGFVHKNLFNDLSR